jgi:hypothetical protein
LAENPSIGCASLRREINYDPPLGEDNTVSMQVAVLSHLCGKLKKKALRKLLDMHGVPYAHDSSLGVLRRILLAYCRRLKSQKKPKSSCGNPEKEDKRKARTLLRMKWPQVVPQHLKKKILSQLNLVSRVRIGLRSLAGVASDKSMRVNGV